jgi:hypothetical protein
VVIDWGDGTSQIPDVQTVNLAAGVLSFGGVSHPYLDNPAPHPSAAGAYRIGVTVTDKDGGQGTGSASVTVTNVAPANVALSLSAASINEGQSVTLGGSFTDPGVRDTHTVVIDWGDGTSQIPDVQTVNLATRGLLTFGVSHPYLDNPAGQPAGSFAIFVTVTDNDNGQGVGSASIQVNNVAPTAGLSGPVNGVPGQPRTFTFYATDPSPVDQAAGFTYTVNWGDGTSQIPDVQTVGRTAGNGGGVAVDHVYTAPGSYTVQVTATDKDGGTSAAVTRLVTVQVVQMQGDTLAVGGTPGTDTITITPADAAGDLTVTVNKVSYPAPAGAPGWHPTGHILVYAQGGANDMVQLLSNKIQGTVKYVTVPAVLYGGSGNDTLDASGSTANNALFGGTGNDILIGSIPDPNTGLGGRDLLVGGGGSDKLTAINGGDSILIGGTTDYGLESTALTYDRKLAAVYAIMAEWGRTDLPGTALQQYQARVAHLMNSIGPNGSWSLNATTMHDDAAADTLTGSAVAFDWFVVGPGSQDTLKNWRTGEVITTVW